MPTAQEIEFGKLVVEHRLATSEQVRECFALQAGLPTPTHIGTLLVERGYLNQQHAHKLFEMQRQSPRQAAPNPADADTALGKQLLAYGLVSQQQLAEVFTEVQQFRANGHGITLGQRLIQRGILRVDQLANLQNKTGSGIKPGLGNDPYANMGSGHRPGFGSSPNAMGSSSHPNFASNPNVMGSSPQAGFASSPNNPGSGSRAFVNPANPAIQNSGFGTSAVSHSGSFGPAPGGTAYNAAAASDALKGKFKDNDPMARKMPQITLADGSIGLDFGDFEVLEEVARGGMGIVYKARHKGRQSIVALKAMKRGENASEKQIRRFQQETEAANNLDHPNVVGVHDAGCHEGFHYYTMDLVEGGALDERIKRGELPTIPKAATIVQEVALAIEHAHSKKIIHRDLKPANILFDGKDHAKVTDFGLAKNVDRKSMLTRTGAVVGTPYYMPPEQARGNTDIDARCDVYALGVILYELLTGKPPFRGETAMEIYQKILEEDPIPPTEKNKSVPRDLEVICLQAMAKKRERRYQSSKDLADDLGRFLKGQKISARPPGIIEKLSEKASKHKTMVMIIAGVLTVLLVGGIGLVFTLAQRATHQNYLSAKENWDKTTQAINQSLTKARRSLDEARDRMSNNPKLSREELSAAEKELSELPGLLLGKVETNRAGRLAMLLFCLDPELRAFLIDDDKVRETPDKAKFIEMAKSRFELYGLSAEGPLAAVSDADLSDYLLFIQSSAVNADPTVEAVKEYRVEDPFLKIDLPELFRTLYLEQGRFATREGKEQDFDLATTKFEKALKYAFRPDESQEIRLEMARALKKRKLPDKALAAYSEILKSSKKGKIAGTAAFERGLLYSQREKLDEALADFTLAISLSLNPTDEYLARGRILMKKKQFQAALDDFSKLLSIKGDSFNGYLERGRAYAALGQLDDAQGSFTEALDKEKHPEAYYEQGVLLTRLKKFKDARRSLQLAIDRAPNYFTDKDVRDKALSRYNKALDEANSGARRP
ncbi:MAG: protein kinase [Planctomycetota bacterium]|nr:protein kinase [Planctomycetota bacterium]